MRRGLTILLAGLSLVAAGCGDEPDTSATGGENSGASTGDARTTKAEFVEQGDAICRDLSLASSVVENPTDETDFARSLKDLRAPTEAGREHWELLEPSPDGAELHDDVLKQLTARLDALNGAITAAESGDTVTAEDLRAQADQSLEAIAGQAREFGFTECGSMGEPTVSDEPADPSQIEEPPAQGEDTAG